MVRRSIDGIAAIAESQSDGCEAEWLGVMYSLETVRNSIDEIIKDFKNRIQEAEDD